MPLALWLVLVAVGAWWGASIPDEAHLHGPPFVGPWRVALAPAIVAAVALAVVVVARGPGVLDRLRWRDAVVVAAALAVAWTVLLAVSGPSGRAGLTAPFDTRYEYLRAVPLVGSPQAWLDGGYLAQIDSLPTHVRSHPPGAVLALWALDRIGWHGPGAAASLALAGVAAAVAAVAFAVREVVGEAAARRVLPFAALAPAWVFASSMDALYAGVAATGVAVGVVATGARGRRRDVLAVASGAILGAGAFLSYGLVLATAPLAVVAARRRALRVLLLGACGAATCVLGVALAGFWWFEGLDATRRAYREGVSGVRPYGYFLVGNLAAFALAVGPVVAVGLGRLRDRAGWLLVGGALLAVAVADVSGLSKGAVERIWLPFAVWLPVAAIALDHRTRGWLAAHAATGVALQVAVRAPW